MEQFTRTIRLLQEEGILKLHQKKVAVFGLGGVGSYVVETLCRMGVGHLVVIDNDVVDISNINRQLYALHSTVGKYKVDIAKARCFDIHSNIIVTTYKQFYLPNEGLEYMFEDCDYVVDAIDTIKAKIALIEACHQRKLPIISAMGTGNKLDPGKFEIMDLRQTTFCPLAKVMRKQLKRRGITTCKVVCSNEKAIKVDGSIPGSVSYVPGSAGLLAASYVVQELLK